GSHKNAPYFLSPPSSQSFVPSSLELPCHPLRPNLVTVTLERDEYIFILKKVPAEICDNCGEYYLSDVVTEQVLEKA
ncbi:MAG: type II toxin-antitoxin system MqsA family antitoxin, partial [Nostoc sp.]|uniref:type II toxin-antitoxin system MqsA family antitoxin n=1 Tax=Nostoc sp. TaxID=1180 RepID=UPI002FF8222D